MRELIIRCDHCGKVIEGNPYKVCLEQIDRETDDYSIEQTEDQKKVREMDWCENCFRNLTAFLLDTSHKLLVASPVTQGATASLKNTEETPVPDASGGAQKRTKIDMGKLKALFEAGWKVKDMAVEFGVSEQAIYLRLKQLQEEKDEKVQ